nr:MAG TPA: protein of unknown function (DUF4258) [Caudoviricetes sp.]
MLTAIKSITQAVNERMIERGMDEKYVKEVLETAFKEGLEIENEKRKN